LKPYTSGQTKITDPTPDVSGERGQGQTPPHPHTRTPLATPTKPNAHTATVQSKVGESLRVRWRRADRRRPDQGVDAQQRATAHSSADRRVQRRTNGSGVDDGLSDDRNMALAVAERDESIGQRLARQRLGHRGDPADRAFGQQVIVLQVSLMQRVEIKIELMQPARAAWSCFDQSCSPVNARSANRFRLASSPQNTEPVAGAYSSRRSFCQRTLPVLRSSTVELNLTLLEDVLNPVMMNPSVAIAASAPRIWLGGR
jgi:hypothetical protein